MMKDMSKLFSHGVVVVDYPLSNRLVKIPISFGYSIKSNLRFIKMPKKAITRYIFS